MKRNLVLLSVLLFFGFVTTASAQVTYQVTTTPTFVINTGRAEALGSIRITSTSPTGTLTLASTIQYSFANIGCDNTTPGAVLPFAAQTAPPLNQGGLILVTDGTFATAAISSVTNTSAGCTVSVTVPSGIATTVNVSYLELQGVRGRVDLSPAGAPAVGVFINGILTATPSTSSLFTVPNVGAVGVSAKALEADFTEGSALVCIGVIANPDVTIKELFNAAFVQYVAVAAPGFPLPVNHRPLFGAVNNTQVHIVITSVPSGVKFAWPAASTLDESSGATGSILTKVSQSTVGDDAVYQFSTPSQSTSDLNSEMWDIVPTPTVPTTAGFGVANGQAQLFPGLITGDATTVTDAPFTAGSVPTPRFNDPLQPSPAAPFFSNGPCVTDLLFPFTANTFGFDTGIAIANTSLDPWGSSGPIVVPNPTLAQSGTCTLYGFPAASPANTGATPPPMVTFTSPTVQAGDTFTMILSSSSNPAFNGFEGYIISICNFQYAHGFAFIQTPVGASPNAAEGYVALIIPDPSIQGVFIAPSRGANNTDWAFRNSGEGLSQ